MLPEAAPKYVLSVWILIGVMYLGVCLGAIDGCLDIFSDPEPRGFSV